jgi:acetyl esterase/lipase
VTTRDVTYPGADGKPLPARIYTPANAGRNAPVIVYFHGGGWVLADIDVYDGGARALAKKTNAIVISADYRRAPEHRFPAAHDDAYAAYRWAIMRAANFGGDATRIAVAGESAGGNLAINVAIRARDAKIQAPAHMLLVYPVAGVDMNTPSYMRHAQAKPLNKPMMEWFVKHVFASPGDAQDSRLDLVGKADLRGLPDATVITADIDPLRSEGEMLAARLTEAGSAVKYENFRGATHEFFGMDAVVKDAAQAQDFAAKELKEAFAPGATGSAREKK